jgi:hypothetical protein
MNSAAGQNLLYIWMKPSMPSWCSPIHSGRRPACCSSFTGRHLFNKAGEFNVNAPNRILKYAHGGKHPESTLEILTRCAFRPAQSIPRPAISRLPTLDALVWPAASSLYRR